MDATLPNEISPLRELVATLQSALSAAQIENKLLRQKLELFLKRYFGGTKNEGLDPKQLELLLAGLTALTTSAPVTEKKTPARSTTATHPVRQPLPAHLETERVVLEPVEVQQAPAGWRKLGEEVTEELDWKPAKFIKRLYIRPKYANADRIVIAPLPARLIEKGLPGADLPRAPRREPLPPNLVRLGGRGGGLVVSDLPGNESGVVSAGLLAGRRNTDSLSGSGCKRQKPARLVVDLQSAAG
jgi:hypothetical protein